MFVTLSGSLMLVRPVHHSNAEPPMLATGRPLIVLGMITAPPEPVYPVIVIAPLLVV
jgi:hypothetical protein